MIEYQSSYGPGGLSRLGLKLFFLTVTKMKVLLLRRITVGKARCVLSREEELGTVFPGLIYVDSHAEILDPDPIAVMEVYFLSETKQSVAVLKPFSYDSDIVNVLLEEGGVDALEAQMHVHSKGWEVHKSNLTTLPYSLA